MQKTWNLTNLDLRPADMEHAGLDIYRLAEKLFPLCRSITGDGFRETLREIMAYVPLEIHEVPTGTQVFDWTVPREWNVRDAYIKNPKGEKIVDFHRSNLHLVSYSIPVRRAVPLAELKEHLYSLPEHPDWIPYRTSYYKEQWGFCLSHRQLEQLEDGEYEVFVDTSLEPGSLTYGEFFLPGREPDEVLISCHCCHPSMANDNLSGMVVSAFLASLLQAHDLRYSYRFLFIPGTIGSITWLALNPEAANRVRHGLVVACAGDPGCMTYKRSRQGNAEIDRVVEYALQDSGEAFNVLDFSPYGYDERQYCSPGFNLPVGSLTRTPHGQYPEYHTSADNLEFVRPECLADSLDKYLAVIGLLENNRTYLNTNPFCEPQLGKRGVYGAMGGKKDSNAKEMAMLWVLNLSDGSNSLLDIAERSGMGFEQIWDAAGILAHHGLLVEAGAKASQSC